TGCGECVEVCPYGAIEVIDGDAVIDPSLCHFCYRCVEQCPEGAIY
ncbi:MAG: 4Fe-4S binding protein, partial [Candidatus Aegiribacteria sp.]|nr:4Fe-4S binding protein [Candidatus Aegiribacteria sp.]